jgi:dTDP-4-dehydrorhamnose reductase
MIGTKILIIGSSGLLGSVLTPYLKNNNFEITTINKSNKNSDYILDVSNFDKTYYLLNKIKPRLILNLSSYTSVEACELKNKEVLILMNKWDTDYYSHYFKSWVKQFKSKGVERVCMKLDGFKSYKEL